MVGTNQKYALEIHDVTKSFGGVHAVRSVSISIPAGQRRALIGPNGAGKTTLFNLITGEIPADSGRFLLFDKDISSNSVEQRARKGLGRTYQTSQLFLELTVEQNLFLASSPKRGKDISLFKKWESYDETRSQILDVAHQVGLEDHLYRHVGELSHGLQRQLEIGMAVAMKPKIILLDEPAAGLSPTERVQLKKLLRDLPTDITMVLIEHDMELVLYVADMIDVLNRGSLIVTDVPDKIQENKEVQEVYLGSSYV